MICAMPVILPDDDETTRRPYCGKEGAIHEIDASYCYLRGNARLICTDCAQWMITWHVYIRYMCANFVV